METAKQAKLRREAIARRNQEARYLSLGQWFQSQPGQPDRPKTAKPDRQCQTPECENTWQPTDYNGARRYCGECKPPKRKPAKPAEDAEVTAFLSDFGLTLAQAKKLANGLDIRTFQDQLAQLEEDHAIDSAGDCALCGEPLPLGGREDRSYCSPACRKAANRVQPASRQFIETYAEKLMSQLSPESGT